MISKGKRILNFIFRFRYLIAFAVFAIAVALQLTGSSIGMFMNYFGYPEDKLLLGQSRIMRSDEWAVLTPMLFSQYFGDSFSYFSDIVRGTTTDVFLEYGQPVFHILIIFRPFYIGYLFLPIGYGMSFFWYGRLIALFMVSLEFGRLITKDKRWLSMIYAAFITFSPVIQWWFAINGLVEMIIYLQLSIIMLDLYFLTDRKIFKSLYALIISFCGVGFVFTMYPPWMIPFCYVIIGLIIYEFVKHKDTINLQIFDLFLAVCSLIFMTAFVLLAFYKSRETITLLSNTVYPGKRFETGGNCFSRLFYYIKNLSFYKTGTGITMNTCEDSYFFDLFPFPAILSVFTMIKKKKTDPLSVSLLVVNAVLFVWISFGMPSFLSKMLFLSLVQARRAVVVFGFVNIVLLFHSLSNLFDKNILESIVTVCISIIALVIIYCGIKVNPIRAGVSDIQSIPELKMVETIRNEDSDALWIVEGCGLPFNNSLLLVGARTVNSTNIYPALENWKKLDPAGEYESIYNRYAHITICLTNTEKPVFELNGAQDSFVVYVNTNDLKLLNVSYIFTKNDLSEHEDLSLLNEYNEFKVYMIK